MFQFEKISVVIPVYNSASYISSTIDSVLSAYPKEYVDIVIVDDKSDDIENLKNVLRFYDSVRLIEKNIKSNAAESRNIGILKSFYDKVFLLDADDQFFLDYLINRIAIMNASNAGVFLVHSLMFIMMVIDYYVVSSIGMRTFVNTYLLIVVILDRQQFQ